MGVEKNINADRYPEQGSWLGRDVEVCFEYDTGCLIKGTVIRDDIEEPRRTIIQLENGWVVLATECQFRLLD